MKKEYKNRTEEYLNERWNIFNDFEKREADKIVYETALKTIEFMGFSWTRDTEGRHIIY